MKVLREVYNSLSERKTELETDMSYWQERREIARAEGDLSENQDYETARQKLEEIYKEHGEIINILTRSEVVEVTTDFNIIDIGCKFHLKVIYPGKNIDKDIFSPEGEKLLYYNKEDNTTVYDGECVFGGPTDQYAESYILSSGSRFAGNLLGKPLGEYRLITTHGVHINVIASKLS